MGEVRVGISGWAYPPWRGRFYPAGLPRRLELAYASRRFNAIEINATFYGLQRASSFRSWHESTPPGFVFAMKGVRHVTHELRLREPRRALANFFASGMLLLREKLGPFVWQLPPSVRFDEGRFRAFFELLPRDTAELARLAEEREAFLAERAHAEPDAVRPVRHAVEFRHESFLTDRFVELLREFGVALVVADTAGRHPTAEDVTAGWVYVRLHGSRELYASGYEAEEIAAWAEKVRAWSGGGGGEAEGARRIGRAAGGHPGGRDVYVFFDNTMGAQRAPEDARAMAETLGVGPGGTVGEVLGALGVGDR